MVKSVEQIEREITTLEQAVLAIAQEFNTSYSHYLTSLGQTVGKQLVLAAYLICTQSYPDRFLQLSLKQRQDLQQALRQLAQQAQTQIPQLLESGSTSSLPIVEEPQTMETKSEPTGASMDSTADGTENFNAPQVAFVEDMDLNPELLEAITKAFQQETLPSPHQPPSPPSSTPTSVAIWLEYLEKQIVERLQTISHSANRLLQQVSILPNNLPDPVLEAAAKAGADAVGPPNLLNIMIETNPKEEQKGKLTQIVAIHLRLIELEFNDALLASMRSQLRNLGMRLNQIGKEYQKKQREKAIARAEAAWRSSWHE